VVTNPAKALAERMSGRQVVIAGDNVATLALARHAAAVLLRLAGKAVAAAGLPDVVAALRTGVATQFGDPVDALFHDEELDGPLSRGPRVLALTLDAERPSVAARVSGYDDVDLVGVEDIGEAGAVPVAMRAEQQLATLAVRLQMAAVYLRLVGG
jgi:hypothetical protein